MHGILNDAWYGSLKDAPAGRLLGECEAEDYTHCR